MAQSKMLVMAFRFGLELSLVEVGQHLLQESDRLILVVDLDGLSFLLLQVFDPLGDQLP